MRFWRWQRYNAVCNVLHIDAAVRTIEVQPVTIVRGPGKRGEGRHVLIEDLDGNYPASLARRPLLF